MVCPSRVSVILRSGKSAVVDSQVMSVFALTVIGTFDVLTAAHIPALSNSN